jgi:hypothetical protein
VPDLPKVRQEYEADTRGYSGPLRDAAQQADRFSDRNSKAALAARKMGLAAKEAADRAAKAMSAAGEAAERLAMGEIDAKEAAEAEAKALKETERAAIAAAEAERAVARAADEAADNMRQAARDAELSAAAQQLGALKAAGATSQYNDLLARLKAEHGDLSKTAVSGFEAMEHEGNLAYRTLTSASEKLADAGPAAIVGIANAIVALPALATVAAGALTLGLGGALAAVGVMFAAKNEEIKAEYSALGHEIFAGLSKDAQPFEDTLRHIAEVGSDELRSWEPEVRGIFKEMAPVVDVAVSQAIRALDEFKPAVRELTAGFDVELEALGGKSGEIAHNIAVGLEAIGEAAQRNPQALANLVNDLSLMVRYGGDAVAFLIRFKNEFDGFTQVLTGGGPLGLLHFVDGLSKLKGLLGGGAGDISNLGHELTGIGSAANQAGNAEMQTGMATQHLMTAQQAATMSTDQLKSALDRLTGANQNAFDANIQYRQALAAATEQAKRSNAGIDGNSKAAIANSQALSNLARSIKTVEENSNLTAAQIQNLRSKFVATAEAMGVSKQRANQLADELLGVRSAANKIPSKKTIDVMAKTAAARGQIAQFIYWAERQHIDLGISTGMSGRAAGGLVGGYADGGMAHAAHLAGGGAARFPIGGQVHGPGTGTSDSIPAMLSNGEYVINAEQTKKYLPLLDAINYKLDGFADGGFAKGGKPTAAQKAAAASRVTLARSRPEYLAALAAQQALEAMRKTVYGGFFGGGPSTIGSAHGSVVQHVTTLHVTVQGNVWETQNLANVLQSVILRNNMALTLPAGRG